MGLETDLAQRMAEDFSPRALRDMAEAAETRREWLCEHADEAPRHSSLRERLLRDMERFNRLAEAIRDVMIDEKEHSS